MSSVKTCLWGVIGVWSDKCLQMGMYFGFSENFFHVFVPVFPKAGHLLSTVQIKTNSDVFQCLLFLSLHLSRH